MMFDSTQYTGPCYDTAHGHSIPATREEHAAAVIEIIQAIKKEYPQLLIELHDPITGPSGIHYTPTYFGYARPDSFDCLWGHEFNLTDQPAERTLTFRLRDAGLPAGRLSVDGAEAQQDGDSVTLKVKVAGKRHALVKLQVVK
jgi:hypothetical protein